MNIDNVGMGIFSCRRSRVAAACGKRVCNPDLRSDGPQLHRPELLGDRAWRNGERLLAVADALDNPGPADFNTLPKTPAYGPKDKPSYADVKDQFDRLGR